jgi:hypothetical protein
MVAVMSTPIDVPPYIDLGQVIERTQGDIARLCRSAGVADGAVSITRDGTNLTLIAKALRPAAGVAET